MTSHPFTTSRTAPVQRPFTTQQAVSELVPSDHAIMEQLELAVARGALGGAR